jgi:hypothetical protein
MIGEAKQSRPDPDGSEFLLSALDALPETYGRGRWTTMSAT